MSYRIASFNMKNLSAGSATAMRLDYISDIILNNRIDIVAMQEVLSAGKALTGIPEKNKENSKTAFERSLLYRLGKDWSTYWDDPQTNSTFYPYLSNDERHEGYAFLWNTRRIELPKNKYGQRVYPTIFRNYKTGFDGKVALRLVRDPLYGRFLIKNTKIELRLITTHIIFGKPDKMKVNFDDGAIKLRRHEFNVLAGNLYRKIDTNHMDIQCTVPYTVVLGDYNLNLPSSIANKYYLDVEGEVAMFDSAGRRTPIRKADSHNIYTIQDELSTISERGYANNYDHFSFDDRVYHYRTNCERIDAVHQYAPADLTEEEKFAWYKKNISDHVPIVLELNFKPRH